MHIRSKGMIMLLGFSTVFATFSVLADSPSPDGAMEYIISPSDGEIVHNPVRVQFGLKGMGVAPAGVRGRPEKWQTRRERGADRADSGPGLGTGGKLRDPG